MYVSFVLLLCAVKIIMSSQVCLSSMFAEPADLEIYNRELRHNTAVCSDKSISAPAAANRIFRARWTQCKAR